MRRRVIHPAVAVVALLGACGQAERNAGGREIPAEPAGGGGRGAPGGVSEEGGVAGEVTSPENGAGGESSEPEADAGGASAGTGSAGAGGNGSTPEQDPCELPCPSQGPCFSAHRDAACDCVHEPLDDDTACDDGDACTEGDTCQAAACVGVPRTQSAGLRGELTSFGAAPRMEAWPYWLQGSAAFLDDERLVFLERGNYEQSRIHLVEVDGDGLTRVDEATTQVSYFADLASAGWLDSWYRPTTHVVALSETRFVVLGAQRYAWGLGQHGMEVFDAEGETLTSRGYVAFPPAQEEMLTVVGVAARDETLWLCGHYDGIGIPTVRAYTLVQGGGGELEFVETDRLDSGAGGCAALALSDDGDTLFAGAHGGIRVFDVSDREFLDEQSPIVLEDRYIEDVQVSAEHLVALSASLDVEQTQDGVLVLSSNDHSLLYNLELDDPNALPFGVALSEQRLFVEWRLPGQEDVSQPNFVVTLHELDSGEAAPSAEWTMRENCCGAEFFGPVRATARGDLAVLQPWRRVVRAAAGGDELSAVSGPEHGSFRTVLRGGANVVTAAGPYSSHRVDISDPDAPVIVSGSTNLPASSADLQLVVPSPGAPPELVNPRGQYLQPRLQREEREHFSIFDGSSVPFQPLGSFWIDSPYEFDWDGPAFDVGGGMLFQVASDESALR
ncbi:MAG TPA: hypothetical protein VM686_19325, partial [Polyangiaceae bacterium]|nr:hypothetical protein [Polyangiaceae bacterium]